MTTYGDILHHITTYDDISLSGLKVISSRGVQCPSLNPVREFDSGLLVESRLVVLLGDPCGRDPFFWVILAGVILLAAQGRRVILGITDQRIP